MAIISFSNERATLTTDPPGRIIEDQVSRPRVSNTDPILTETDIPILTETNLPLFTERRNISVIYTEDYRPIFTELDINLTTE